MEHQWRCQVCINGRAQMWTIWALDYSKAVSEVQHRLDFHKGGYIVDIRPAVDPNGMDVL